jgi:sugar O-acyltransferase (sialic acid O-acetyltransferase NeuD family)
MSTYNVIIIGAGGHGAEIDDYINLSNKTLQSEFYKIAGYIDDDPDSYSRYKFSGPYLGSIKNHQIRKDCHYVIGIANLEFRKSIVNLFLEKGAQFLTLIHPTAFISSSATIGTGVVIGPMANVGPNVSVGDFTIINSRSSLGHDTKVGAFNFISPNVCFSGFTVIGDNNLFGINSATIPHVKVGSNNKIMAGMVLDQDVGDNQVVFYRFKEKIIAIKG